MKAVETRSSARANGFFYFQSIELHVEMSFQWEKCEAIFPSEWTLTTDVKKTEHTQATQVKIIAEMQQKTIEEEEPLDCSIVDGDTGDGQSPKLFRCNICFQLLTTKQTFKTHYDSLHLGKKITCKNMGRTQARYSLHARNTTQLRRM